MNEKIKTKENEQTFEMITSVSINGKENIIRVFEINTLHNKKIPTNDKYIIISAHIFFILIMPAINPQQFRIKKAAALIEFQNNIFFISPISQWKK
jgi:hypothetical protein